MTLDSIRNSCDVFNVFPLEYGALQLAHMRMWGSKRGRWGGDKDNREGIARRKIDWTSVVSSMPTADMRRGQNAHGFIQLILIGWARSFLIFKG